VRHRRGRIAVVSTQRPLPIQIIFYVILYLCPNCPSFCQPASGLVSAFSRFARRVLTRSTVMCDQAPARGGSMPSSFSRFAMARADMPSMDSSVSRSASSHSASGAKRGFTPPRNRENSSCYRATPLGSSLRQGARFALRVDDVRRGENSRCATLLGQTQADAAAVGAPGRRANAD
jgi:hypothetical protein